jgi:8-oxo-dGTP diphosphatase
MTSSNYNPKTNKLSKPFIGLLMFILSIALSIITIPFGLLFGVFYTLYKSSIIGLGEYFVKMAISIDQSGNVIIQHLFNTIWIKEDGYKFGNRDETISSVIGKNQIIGKLTYFGKLINNILDYIDPNHSLNSIDYHIEG